MNKIYKTVWSEKKGTYVAVSEIVTNRGKEAGGSEEASTSKPSGRLKTLASILLSIGFVSGLAVSGVAAAYELGLNEDLVLNGGTITGLTSLSVGGTVISSTGINANNKTITNVADAVNNTDAVNLKQLNAAKSNVVAGTGLAVTSTTGENGTAYTVALSPDTQSSLTNANNAIQSFTTAVGGAKAQTLNKTTSQANFVAGDNIQLTGATTGITIATAKEVTFDKVAVDGVIVDGGTITGLTNTTVDGGGFGGNRAATEAQLKTAMDALDLLQKGNSSNNYTGIKYFRVNSTKDDANAEGEDSIAIGPLAEAKQDTSVAIGHEASADGKASIALGDGAKVTSANPDDPTVAAISIGNGATTSASNAIAIGNTASAVASQGIALGGGAQANAWQNISIGHNAGLGTGEGDPLDQRQNTAIGAEAGQNVVGYGNVALGVKAGNGVNGNSNIIMGLWNNSRCNNKKT